MTTPISLDEVLDACGRDASGKTENWQIVCKHLAMHLIEARAEIDRLKDRCYDLSDRIASLARGEVEGQP